MSVIAISGSQSQGKSTVLKALGNLGYNTVQRQSSRTILKEWGFTLNEVNKYPPLVKKFQEEILTRQINDDNGALSRTQDPQSEFYYNKPMFLERSYADRMGYAIFCLASYNEYDEWLNQYYEQCKKYQQRYDCVIYLSGRTGYVPENDGVRSVNPQFAKCADLVIRHYIEDFNNGNVLYVDEPNHEKRIEIIVNKLESLKK